MDKDLQWVVGIGITLTTTLVIAIIGAFKNLSAKISSSNSNLYDEVKVIKKEYVRRDDFKDHLNRIDASLRQIREENREYTKQLMEAIKK